MIKSLFRIFLISLFIISCSIGRKGVYFKEMGKQPLIEIGNGKIIITSDNSIQNSALLIYKIDFSVDTIKKIIELKGFQAINKEYKNSFELKLNGLTQKQLDKYEYFWIDPDKNRNRIENIKK